VRTVALALGLDAEETVSRLHAEPGILGRRPVRRLSRVRVFATVALVVAAGFLFLLGRAAFEDLPANLSAGEPVTTMRRDPVRTLAESQAVARPAEQSTTLAAAPPVSTDVDDDSSAPAPVAARDSAVRAR
jgi:hypothetical protein